VGIPVSIIVGTSKIDARIEIENYINSFP